MKKFYYILLLLLPVLSMIGCSDENLYDGDSESAMATLSYRVSLDDELDSRAIGDGEKVNQLKVGIFQDGAHIKTETIDNQVDGKFPVELTLLKNLEYTIVFWAQARDNGIYTLDEETFKVDINYSEYTDISLVSTEAFEVFCAKDKVILGNNNTNEKSLNLTRPFAQLNIAAKEADVFDKVESASLTIENVYTGINLLTGQPVGNATGMSLSFKYSDEDATTKQSIEIGEENYYYVASAYLFSPEKVKLTGELYDGNNSVVKSFEFPEVTLKPNYRTNIYGEMIQVEELAPWDGIIPTESPLTTDEQNRYIIDEEADLAWLSVADNTSNLSESSTFIVTKDVLNMGEKTISSIQLPAGSTFEGNEKTIKNFANSLFGDATNITVQNLVLDNVVATSTDSHVGVLVNTLKGSSSFINVSVKNSSATTTNGAAGGMVGYISRIEQNNQNEKLTITFDNCHITDTTVEGTQSEGHFVGLLRGYDNQEKLQFNNNCTLTLPTTVSQADEFVSPYREGNEGVWLASNDYLKYDGWLGDEEYYRGTVIYGDSRFIPCWDGTTNDIVPLKDGTTNLIYSAFDLAYFQGKAAGNIKLMENVCMEHDLDGASKDGVRNHIFTALNTLTTLEGNGKTIYNISIRDNYYGGFVKSDNCATTFKDVTFDGADIRVTYDTSTGNAYVGTLRGLAYAKTIVNNVQVKNGYLYGVNKMGGLCGAIFAELDCDDSSVCNYILENQEVLIIDPIFSISSYEIGFYPHGEIGGLIGFISANANIDNCQVKETKLKCVGVKDMDWFNNSKIPGRHINQFIGDIRTTSGQIININSCSVANNSYQTQTFTNNQSESKGTNFSWYYTLKERASSSRWNLVSSCTYTKNTVNPEEELVGCCYYIFCEVYALFGSMYKIMADTKGELWIDGTRKF